jgi:hypothetical protein
VERKKKPKEDENPHPKGTPEYYAWEGGWGVGYDYRKKQEKAVLKMGVVHWNDGVNSTINRIRKEIKDNPEFEFKPRGILEAIRKELVEEGVAKESP